MRFLYKLQALVDKHTKHKDQEIPVQITGTSWQTHKSQGPCDSCTNYRCWLTNHKDHEIPVQITLASLSWPPPLSSPWGSPNVWGDSCVCNHFPTPVHTVWHIHKCSCCLSSVSQLQPWSSCNVGWDGCVCNHFPPSVHTVLHVYKCSCSLTLLVFLSYNPEVHPILSEMVVRANFSLHLHILLYLHTTHPPCAPWNLNHFCKSAKMPAHLYTNINKTFDTNRANLQNVCNVILQFIAVVLQFFKAAIRLLQSECSI